MPCKSHAVVYSAHELLVRAVRVGVTHIVEHSDAERLLVASRASSLEAHDFGLSRAVGSWDLIEVGRVWTETLELDIVEVL